MEVDKHDETFYHDENTHKWLDAELLKVRGNEDWELEHQAKFPLVMLVRYWAIESTCLDQGEKQLPDSLDEAHYPPLSSPAELVSPPQLAPKKTGGQSGLVGIVTSIRRQGNLAAMSKGSPGTSSLTGVTNVETPGKKPSTPMPSQSQGGVSTMWVNIILRVAPGNTTESILIYRGKEGAVWPQAAQA